MALRYTKTMKISSQSSRQTDEFSNQYMYYGIISGIYGGRLTSHTYDTPRPLCIFPISKGARLHLAAVINSPGLESGHGVSRGR